jgi:ubiquinone/menaquinone biosynthesis C-methylase UbiE
VSAHSSNQFRIVQSLNEALSEINVGGIDSEEQHDREHHQQIKRSIEQSYDLYGSRGAGMFSASDLFQFWNWGMYREDIQRELTKLLGAFDARHSDGQSEQLYYYTLSKIPRPQTGERRILEVGCGNGAGLNFLSRTEPRSAFVGLDISGHAVNRANDRYSRQHALEYVQGDAEELPFKDGEFDAVINVESAHNYPNLGKFLAEVARVLRPGGYFSQVDAFTDVRLAAMQRCKGDCADRLSFQQGEDITPYVKESIRRRMVPGSMFHRHMKESLRTIPWPADRLVAATITVGYGRGFTETTSQKWLKRLPKRISARWGMLPFMTSYQHMLATKPAA